MTSPTGVHGTDGSFIPLFSREIVSGVSISSAGKIFATTVAALKTLPATARYEGLEAAVLSDNSKWIFRASSALVDATNNLVLTPDAGSGAWHRTDKVVSLKLAIGFATADAAALFTMPASGFRLAFSPGDIYWEVTADWTGGTNSAIGVSASLAPHSTKGDLLGGSGGNVLAELTAAIGVTQGTIGVSFSAAPKKVILEPTAVVRFDRIVDAFSAGAGFVHMDATVVQ